MIAKYTHILFISLATVGGLCLVSNCFAENSVNSVHSVVVVPNIVPTSPPSASPNDSSVFDIQNVDTSVEQDIQQSNSAVQLDKGTVEQDIQSTREDIQNRRW